YRARGDPGARALADHRLGMARGGRHGARVRAAVPAVGGRSALGMSRAAASMGPSNLPRAGWACLDRGMTFFDAIKTVFRKYAEFGGRATRPEFWWWTLFTTLVSAALNALSVPMYGVMYSRMLDSGP